MISQNDHNKIIKKIAKEQLKSFGIFQKGQSRTFLYDRGWFIIVIEFQPSSWSRGTYLKIGIDFNFYPRNYFAFSYGDIEIGFEEFKNDEQFSKQVNALCDLTIRRVQELDNKFIDVWAALKIADIEKENDIWRIYEVAILNILASNFEEAKNLLRQISRLKCEHNWQIERKKIADELLNWLQESPESLDKIKNIIYETRQLKKLPELTLDNFTVRKNSPNSNLPKTGRSWLKILLSQE